MESSSTMNDKEGLDAIMLTAAAVAVVVGSSLVLLQSDAVSRYVLSPPRLYTKRKQARTSHYKSCFLKQLLQIKYSLLGGGKASYNEEMDRVMTSILTTREELQDILTNDILIPFKSKSSNNSNKKSNDKDNTIGDPPQIITIQLDSQDERREQEFWLYLALSYRRGQSGNNDRRSDEELMIQKRNLRRMVQVPLTTFGAMLGEAFENELTSIAFCFVADASCGEASSNLATIVEQSCKDTVAVVREPLWMAAFADMLNNTEVPLQSSCPKKRLEQILFGLCRLEAKRAIMLSSSSSSSGGSGGSNTIKTVMITLPGQSSVPALLPLLQATFGHERHVFCYNGCSPSVQYAMSLSSSSSSSSSSSNNNTNDINNNGTTSINNDSGGSFGFATKASALYCNPPFAPRIKGLMAALSKLGYTEASATEAWMSSVDAFLRLKAEEKSNGYLPFVLKYSNLLAIPVEEAVGEKGDVDDKKWLALINALQYITGSRSRPLSSQVVDAAISSLRDIIRQQQQRQQRAAGAAAAATLTAVSTPLVVALKESTRLAIEECVFLHKGILIGDKTLMDTVKPQKEWSLKAAKKLTACACCFVPGEEEEEEEQVGVAAAAAAAENDELAAALDNNEQQQRRRQDNMMNNDVAAATTSRPSYVDGKTMFAFDPSAFTGLQS